MERPRWINYLKTPALGLPKKEKKMHTPISDLYFFSDLKGFFFFFRWQEKKKRSIYFSLPAKTDALLDLPHKKKANGLKGYTANGSFPKNNQLVFSQLFNMICPDKQVYFNLCILSFNPWLCARVA